MDQCLKIVLLQRVLPAYRESVFDCVRQQASQAGHAFELWVSRAAGSFAGRGTEGGLPWAQGMPVRRIFGRFGLEWQSLPWRNVLACDVMIVPDNLRVLSNLFALLLRRLAGKPALTWGHGANFQPDGLSRLATSVRFHLLRLASGHLVYTDACVGPMVAAGFDRTRISIVGNAIDASSATDLHAHHPAVLEFRARHGLHDDPCVVFLGSWYARKRPELIIRIGEAVRAQVPNARVLVIGGGDGLATLKASNLPWLTLLGPLHGRDKFVALSSARCLAVTGVAGLNLLDAMAMGLPVVVPQRSDHSPEVAYVQDGLNGALVPDAVPPLAEACAQLCLDDAAHSRMSEQAKRTAMALTVERMACNILSGALAAGCNDFAQDAG